MRAPLDDGDAIRVDGVSKVFRLPQEQVHTLKERVLHPTRGRRFEPLEALKDVSFTVGKGEFFGIVGRNGSGKSTLMKCLAGVYRADAGEIWGRGRMAPFIELGVGFNPELTARDNVLINAVMLGLSPAEARARYDDIIAFAELEEFQDLNLKNYSSGMQVRLAFSVMVHVDADVLLIDEVLAVGDAAFQQKCHDALNAAREAGKTILLITHDMDQVQRFCDRAMLLERGNLVEIGDPRSVARRYMHLNFNQPERTAAAAAIEAGGAGDGTALIQDAWLQDGPGRRTNQIEQGSAVALCMRVRHLSDVEEPVYGFVLHDDQRRPILALSTEWDEEPAAAVQAGDLIDVALSFDLWLAPGRYYLTPQVVYPGGNGRTMAIQEDVETIVITGSRAGGGVVDPPHKFYVHPAIAPSTPPRPDGAPSPA